MSAGVWSRLRERVGEAWNRHGRYRELYRQLDWMRADVKARTAWMDGLSEEELAEMLRSLAGCIDAVQATDGDTPEGREGGA